MTEHPKQRHDTHGSTVGDVPCNEVGHGRYLLEPQWR